MDPSCFAAAVSRDFVRRPLDVEVEALGEEAAAVVVCFLIEGLVALAVVVMEVVVMLVGAQCVYWQSEGLLEVC